MDSEGIERKLTLEELTELAGDRFDEISTILQRPVTQEEFNDQISETINNILDTQKEEELKQLPIKRLQFFEHILRKFIKLIISDVLIALI